MTLPPFDLTPADTPAPYTTARVRVLDPDRVLDDSVTAQALAGRVLLVDETAQHTLVLPPSVARALARGLLAAAQLAEEWSPPSAPAAPAPGAVEARPLETAPSFGGVL